MATLTIRNLNEETKKSLRFRAARNGVSVEQEVRSILDDIAASDADQHDWESESLYKSIRRLVEPYGGFEIELPQRGSAREPPSFE